MSKKFLWYNGSNLLKMTDEQGREPNVYISASGRSYGKTTFFYNFLLKNALTLNERFVILCRNKLDINGICQNFVNSFWYDETQELMNDEDAFVVKNLSDGIIKQILYGDKIIGHCFALSSSNKIKSVSKILEVELGYTFFDEFIIEDGSYYLNKEAYKLQSVLQSIYRTKPYKLILAGNLISSINPLFSTFKNSANQDITDMLSINPEAKRLKGIGWVMEIAEQSEELKRTLSDNNRAFGASEYFNISVSNSFQDDKSMIDKSMAKLKKRDVCYLLSDDKKYRLSCTKEGKYYFEEWSDEPPLLAMVYTITQNNISEGVSYINTSHAIRNSLRELYDNGLVKFDKLTTKTVYIQFIKY